MNVQLPVQMDQQAFLAWVQQREERYELARGRVVMMTGGTMRHGLIIGNLFELLRGRVDRKRWVVLTEFGIDVDPGTIRYADIVVDQWGASGNALTAKAPVLVAEVLSPSTTKVDLGDKTADYLKIPTLATYLVFAQDEIKAWAYHRGGTVPGPQVFTGAEASISVPALNLHLLLGDIYAGIDFE